jgi:hypothetical protein
LDDYEEGTWTPNQGGGLTVTGTFSSSGRYTKIGKIVHVQFEIYGSAMLACSAGGIVCTNLPFAAQSALYFPGAATNHGNDVSNGGMARDSSVRNFESYSAQAGYHYCITYNIG